MDNLLKITDSFEVRYDNEKKTVTINPVSLPPRVGTIHIQLDQDTHSNDLQVRDIATKLVDLLDALLETELNDLEIQVENLENKIEEMQDTIDSMEWEHDQELEESYDRGYDLGYSEGREEGVNSTTDEWEHKLSAIEDQYNQEIYDLQQEINELENGQDV